MTLPEYRFYARAVVERNHLRSDTSLLRAYSFELLKAINFKDARNAADSLIIIQQTLALDAQGKAHQAAQNEAIQAKKKVRFWRTVSFIGIGLLPVVFLVK